MIKGLNTLITYVRDMPRSVAFYRDVLDLPLVTEGPGWSQFDLGNGLALGLHMMRGGGAAPAPGWVPSFSVEDVKAARERITSAGAKLTQDFHDIPGGVVIEFEDPNGNPISLTQQGITAAELGVAAAQR